MKMVLSYSVCFLYVMCMSLCGCPPDDYEEHVEYEAIIPNVVQIEGEKTDFIQGDTLFLAVEVPKVVSAEGELIDLQDDLRVQSCHFTLKLSKMGSFANPAVLSLSENEFVVLDGDAYLDDYDNSRIYCSAMFNNESFVFRFGILLKEKGNFILSQYDQTKNEWFFVFSDEKVEQNIHETVIVKSPLTSAGSTDLGLEFTVN
ncbi:hypothetical protein [Flagellimonas sp. 2504JD1-5]